MSGKPFVFRFIVSSIAVGFVVTSIVALVSGRIAWRIGSPFGALGACLLASMCYSVWQLAEAVIDSEITSATGTLAKGAIIAGRESLQTEAIMSVFRYGVIALIVATVVASLVIWYSLRPLRSLSRQINRFTEGDFDVDGIVNTTGELGDIHRAVSEMGVSLAIKAYETDHMISSFYRFTPRGVSKLLGRSGIMEVGSGDVTTIDDCIAIVSVENGGEAMHRTDNRKFMTFVNLCFSNIYECVNKHNGMLLSGDFHLSSLPVLFSSLAGSKRGDALRFGLSLIDRTSGEPDEVQDDLQAGANADSDDLPAPDFFLLLHKMEFIYGIAGTEQKAFPFISSAELGFLNSYNKRLWSLGLHMVATEQYLDEIAKSGVNADSITARRYIGILSSDDGSRNYKLYEMLDCLADTERDLRKSYDEKLQDAIRLFYKDNFYLAMIEFSSILKLNPRDGLARWYVFACEKYFNEGDNTKARYNLFGAEEKKTE
jgi:hypothetical protein